MFSNVGDIVGLYPNKGDSSDLIASGLVASSRSRNISVAFNEAFDLLTTSLYRLMKLTNDVTYRRLNRYVQMLFCILRKILLKRWIKIPRRTREYLFSTKVINAISSTLPALCVGSTELAESGKLSVSLP